MRRGGPSVRSVTHRVTDVGLQRAASPADVPGMTHESQRSRPVAGEGRPRERCPRCDAPLVVIAVPATSGGALELRSCSRCDARWWSQEGAQVGIDRVLGSLDTARRRRTA